MDKKPLSNHGEGDPEAAERFNAAEKAFVESSRGKQKIENGPNVSAAEEAELANAEKVGRDHAKYDDSGSPARK